MKRSQQRELVMAISCNELVREYCGVNYWVGVTSQGVWLVAINIQVQSEPLERFNWHNFIDKADIVLSYNYLLPSQRLQRLAGRLCAKLALAQLNDTEPECISIEVSRKPSNAGQPLSDNGHISISHSGDWVVAAAAANPVGIDVQQIGPFAEQALEYVFKPQEKRHRHARKLTLIWSLKEAYLKALGRSLIPFVEYLETKQYGEDWIVEDSFLSLSKEAEITAVQVMEFEFYGSYVVAVCLIEGKNETQVIHKCSLQQGVENK